MWAITAPPMATSARKDVFGRAALNRPSTSIASSLVFCTCTDTRNWGGRMENARVGGGGAWLGTPDRTTQLSDSPDPVPQAAIAHSPNTLSVLVVVCEF